MAVGSSTGITFSGLASGIDTDSIVSRLIELESQPIQRIKQQQAILQNRKSAYDQLRNQIVSFNSTVAAFNSPLSFSGMKTTSSDTSLATVTATSGGDEGVHDLIVKKLATAHKLASKAQANPTSTLGLAGSFKVNDASISVTESDTLTSIAQKINDANVDVTASIINGGTGKAYLSLTSKKTGLENAIELQDVVGTTARARHNGVLAKLGLIDVAAETEVENGVHSRTFANSTDPLAMLDGGLSEIKLGVNGTEFSFDASSKSLNDIVNDINAQNIPGVLADVEGNATDGYRLRIAGIPDPTITLGDEFGFTATTRSTNYSAINDTVLVSAADAEFSVDGIDFTSAENTNTSIIGGATINFVKADPTKSVAISVSKDTEASVGLVKSFVTAYNRLNSFIRDNAKFDSDTFESGIFFSDNVANTVLNQLSNMLFTPVSGLSSSMNNLTQLGITFDSNAALKLDESVLKSKLESDTTGTANILRTFGTSANNELKFVSSGSKTKSSSGDGYDVNITQVAKKTQFTSSVAQSGLSAAEETLTFTGTVFGSTPISINLSAGSSASDTVSRINADSRLNGNVEAELVDGKIVVRSKRYGAAADFLVTSNLSAASNNSGIGTFGQAIKITGTDVQGTINGEAATGSGQFLLGKADNATTEGLQIQYTGSATGAIGKLKVTKGVGSMLLDIVDSLTNTTNGLFTTSNTGLDSQINEMTDQIKSMQTRISERTVELKTKFAAMESAMAASQQQLARLQQMLK